jgi:predicted phosphodiesterase
MKYAVIADIHANLPALQAVLADADRERCERVVCLGDVVGYGFQPAECVRLVRQAVSACVKGDHDKYVTAPHFADGFNPAALKALEWTRSQLSADDLTWLGSLPLQLDLDGFTLVHATLDAPQRWGYVFEKLEAAASIHYQVQPLCFYGHTHVPVAFVRDSGIRGGTFQSFRLERGKRYLVNPGSVGQPRDTNRDSAYVTYDKDSRTVTLRRVPYVPDLRKPF